MPTLEMESWKHGRQDLFDQLTKACNRIGEDLAAELDDQRTVRIDREELRLIREAADQTGKLAEHNARLFEELEKYREATERVEVLEKENKRLAGVIAQNLQQQAVSNPRQRHIPGSSSKPTPGPNEPSSSAAPIEPDSSRSVPWEKHQSMIAKYNKLAKSYEDLKDVKKTLNELLAAERDKNRNWTSLSKNHDAAIEKKNDRINRLEAEIKRLKERPCGHRDSSVIPFSAVEDPQDAQSVLGRPQTADVGLIQITASSPVKLPRPEITILGDPSTDGQDGSAPFDDLLELPRHHPDNAESVEDTEFEPIEVHNSSTTQGSSDQISPRKTATQVMTGNSKSELPLSPDSPVIVSARSVKKRKNRHDNTDSNITPRIKVETIFSSPIGLAAMFLDPNESIDLDDIGEKVDTPRKQRRLLALSRHSSGAMSYSPYPAKSRVQSQGHSNTAERRGSGTSSQETPARRRDSVLQPRSTNRQVLPRTSGDRVAKKRRIASDEAVGELVEDGEIAAATERERRHTSDTSLDDLLAKPSPPKQILSPARIDHTTNQRTGAARPIATSRLAHEVLHVSHKGTADGSQSNDRPSWSNGRSHQSGDPSRPSSRDSLAGSVQTFRPSSKDSIKRPQDHSRPSSKGSLRASADPSRPTSRDTILRGSSEISRSPSIYDEVDLIPPRRTNLEAFFKPSPRSVETPKASSRQVTGFGKRSTVKISRLGLGRSDWEMDPEQEPLRSRPVSKLNIHDFRVNPDYNQGYDYAFRDVVRDQAARKCLQGCTRPECCGNKFRALAEVSRSVEQSRTLSQQEEEQMLLIEFMGDNAHKIRNMSKVEKEEMTLQARTRDLANKYGRHRHAYQRRTSPPGFWRADFPTTQEQIADREMAKDSERDTVDYRYKEAMRPGGAFIFRDE